MSIITRLYNYQDCRNKKVFKDSHRDRLRRWVWYNSPYFLLIGVILLWIILILGLIQYGACTESGEQYNHLQDCACILHFTGGLL